MPEKWHYTVQMCYCRGEIIQGPNHVRKTKRNRSRGHFMATIVLDAMRDVYNVYVMKYTAMHGGNSMFNIPLLSVCIYKNKYVILSLVVPF